MDSIIVEGGKPLNGDVFISGSKNSSLPLLAATLLASGTFVFDNMPDLKDVATMCQLLEQLGCQIDRCDKKITIHSPETWNNISIAPYDLVKTMRASILVLGPLVARRGHARVSLPGGCSIGSRPIDQHLEALTAMGATVSLDHGYVDASAKQLQGARIVFDLPSVTGTENILMAAVCTEGTTWIENAACEPEVEELAEVLIKMGASIQGVGTSHLRIEGNNNLSAVSHSIIPDRIEAGTFMIAAAVTGGDVTLHDINPKHLEVITAKLRSAGVKITASKENNHKTFRVQSDGNFSPFSITTHPYPGFPTDMQAQFMVLATQTHGQSTINEHIFENRFMHVAELNRMGASISVQGSTAVISGKTPLSGTTVMATDLRAGASMILAGLIAQQPTHVQRVYHIDRGYERFEKKLAALGASIRRVS